MGDEQHNPNKPLELSIEFAPGDVSVAVRLNGKDDVPRLWLYKNVVYAGNLFRLHDEIGFPLACALDECRKRGWKPCLGEFYFAAIAAGWTKDRAYATVREAIQDGICSDDEKTAQMKEIERYVAPT